LICDQRTRISCPILFADILHARYPAYVRLNMSHSGNGHFPDHGKPRGNYTGQRLKQLRPETYRRVVQLLAEPREHVSIREICRQCHVTDDTVKAIEQREAVPII